MPIGAHLGIGKGLAGAVVEARGMGADALQVFTRAPAMWRAAPIKPEAAAAFRAAHAEAPMEVVVHDSYLVNLCAEGEELREKSRAGLALEMDRCAVYGIGLVVSHIGSHVRQSYTDGTRVAAEAIRSILQDSDPSVTLLMETTAGTGTTLGASFEALADLLDAVHGDPRVGVCLDTCHIFAAGYDLRTPEAVADTLGRFGETLGFDRLRAVHLNDSKGTLGSKKDRHANLGAGEIGFEGLRAFVRDPRLTETPIILETPQEGDGHRRDLEWLREARS